MASERLSLKQSLDTAGFIEGFAELSGQQAHRDYQSVPIISRTRVSSICPRNCIHTQLISYAIVKMPLCRRFKPPGTSTSTSDATQDTTVSMTTFSDLQTDFNRTIVDQQSYLHLGLDYFHNGSYGNQSSWNETYKAGQSKHWINEIQLIKAVVLVVVVIVLLLSTCKILFKTFSKFTGGTSRRNFMV